MRRSGDEVVANVVRIFEISSVRVAVEQGTRVDPILVGRVCLEDLGTSLAFLALRAAPIDLSSQMVGQYLVREREYAFGV